MVGDKQKITERGSFFGDFFLIDRQKSPEARLSSKLIFTAAFFLSSHLARGRVTEISMEPKENTAEAEAIPGE